jgi:hypothetical protein
MGMADWQEHYDGGSAEAERKIFAELAEAMLAVQEGNRRKAAQGRPDRTLHAKTLVGVTEARLVVDQTLPAAFRVMHFQPGATLPVAVRFSNASAIPQPDSAPDMRGVALKIQLDGHEVHDLLMTSYPVSHARNARQFVEFAVIAQGPRETLVERLIAHFGEGEARRMIGNVQHASQRCASLATQRFWSRGAVLWGNTPVRFDLRPAALAEPSASESEEPDFLRTEFANRLASKDLSFRLALQPFVSEQETPIEDASVQWREDISAPIEIATLVISQQVLDSTDGKLQADMVAAMAFNPWNAPAAFRPLGNLNRVRGVVYGRSAARWQRGQ